MKKSLWKSRLAGVLIVSMLSSTFSYAGTWQREAEGWIWQDQGVRATGWLKEPGDSWYHFTPDGLMETGWYQESSGDRYYLNRAGEGTEGQMRTGWFLENGKWYFLSPVHDGFFGRAARDQWLWIDGYCYRFDANGVMYADCTTPDGYTVNGDGQWTVNSVVQYQEGKGILTKVTKDGGSGSDGGSGGSSGGSGGSGWNRPGGGDNPGGDNPGGDGKPGSGDNPGEDDKPDGGDNPGGTDKPGGEDKPGEGDKPSGEGSGSLTIRYMVQDTGEILYEKDVSDKIGELYAIQYPAMDGYKLLPDQRKSVYFQKDPQTIPVYYRPIQSGEAPDESVVLQDHVKGILSNTAEEKKVVEQIASDFFDINLDDEGNVEWAVYNTNPIYVYIQEGSVQPGDILYIDPCDQFPIGFVFTYESHDDEYTGSYSNYNAGSYEVLHGQKSSIFEMMGPGTSFSFDSDGAEVPAQPTFTWDPWEDKTIMIGQDTTRSVRSAQRATVDRKISVLIEYGDEFKETEENGNSQPDTEDGNGDEGSSQPDTGDGNGNEGSSQPDTGDGNGNEGSSQPDTGDGNGNEGSSQPDTGDGNGDEGSSQPDTGNDKKKLVFKPSVEGEAYAETNITIDIPITKKDPEVYISFKPGFKGRASLAISGEGDVGAKLLKLLSDKTGKEIPKETKLSLLFMDINVEGVDLSDRLVLGFYGWNIITKLPEANINNVLSDQVSILEIDKSLFFVVPVTVNLKAVIEGEIGPYVDIEFEYPMVYDSKNDSDPLTLGPSKSTLEAGAKISVSGELDAGLGISAGLAAGGIIPALFDLRLLGIDASGEAEGKLTVLPQLGFQGAAEIKGSVYSKTEWRLKLKVSKEKDGVDAAIEVDEVIRPDIGPFKNGKITWKKFEFAKASIIPTTLMFDKDTALKAVDENGTDISSQFRTYDPVTKRVVVKPDGSGGFSFECPRYYMEGDKIYEITEIVTEPQMPTPWAPERLDLDLSRVTGLKTLIITTGKNIHLDLSNNKELTTLCTMGRGISGAGENALPVPPEFKNKIYSTGTIDGNLDLSGCPKLQTLWIEVRNTDKVDLNKQYNLDHLGLVFSDDNKPKKAELILPAGGGDIKSLLVSPIGGTSPYLNPFPTDHLKALEYAEFDSKETRLDLSRCAQLKHLVINNIPNIKAMDLSKNTLLEYLDMKHSPIQELNIANCLRLKSITWNGSLYVFTGNGLLFPDIQSAWGITWYRNKECTEDQKITDQTCKNGETIYRFGYTPSSRTAALTATASNAKKATNSNASSVFSGSQAPDRVSLEHGTAGGAGNGSGADGSTAWTATGSNLDSQNWSGNTGNGLWDSGDDDDDDDEAFGDFELELVNDLFYAMALGSSGGRVRVLSAEWLSPEAAAYPAGLTENMGGASGAFPARKTKLPLAPTERGRQSHTWFYIPETGSSLKPEGEDGEQ